MEGYKVKVGVGHRYGFCFTITDISYLVIGLFHDLVQPLIVIFVISSSIAPPICALVIERAKESTFRWRIQGVYGVYVFPPA